MQLWLHRDVVESQPLKMVVNLPPCLQVGVGIQNKNKFASFSQGIEEMEIANRNEKKQSSS